MRLHDIEKEDRQMQERVLSAEDKQLIRECKIERERLRKLYAELTDRKLAEKFSCAPITIWRVKI